MNNIKINKKFIYTGLILFISVISITINSKFIFAQENLTTEDTTETSTITKENTTETTLKENTTETTTLNIVTTEKSIETTTLNTTINIDENINVKNKVDNLEIKVDNIEEKLDKLINSTKPTQSTKPTKKTIPNNDIEKIKKSTPIQPKQATQPKTETTTQITEDKKEVRYPNKLTPKQNSSSEDTNTNTGIATEPIKSRATVTENKNNANQDYPIYHNNEVVNNKYLAISN